MSITNQKIAYNFANFKASPNKTKNMFAQGANMFFTSKTLYSYGKHFPIAMFLDKNTVIVNTDTPSTTTARHIAVTLAELRSAGLTILTGDTELIEHLAVTPLSSSQAERVKHIAKTLAKELKDKAKRCHKKNFMIYTRQSKNVMDNYIRLCNYYGIKSSHKHLVTRLNKKDIKQC